MNDFRVVIDAGHGGTDPGAVSNGVNEKNLNLMISQYMYQRFQEAGIPVTLIRSTDETISPSERVKKIMDAYGNNPNVVVLSNHINSNATGTAEGAEVIYALRNEDTLAKNILMALNNEGQVVRNYYQRRSANNPNLDYYFIHRETGVTEPLIIEYGFINNPNDLARIQSNYKKYVDAVVRAVIETKNGTMSSANTYVVKPGDTLFSIARTYNTTVEAIKKMNNLMLDDLRIGQLLIIPTSKPNDPVIPENTSTYTVKQGTTLWQISKLFNTSVEELMKLNNLENDLIYPGQILKVPLNEIGTPGQSHGLTHTVQISDTLWFLARKYNTTVEAIKMANNLTNDMIFPGQILKIPKGTLGSENMNVIYTVQKGDTLWQIANNYNTTVEAIMKLNNLESNLIIPGQTLKIY